MWLYVVDFIDASAGTHVVGTGTLSYSLQFFILALEEECEGNAFGSVCLYVCPSGRVTQKLSD